MVTDKSDHPNLKKLEPLVYFAGLPVL